MRSLLVLSLLALGLLSVPTTSARAAAPAASNDPLAPIAWMTGTWKAQVPSPGGGDPIPVDLRIYSVLGGKAIGFTTSFSGVPQYQGIFAYDPAQKAIAFWYPSADGELTVGTITPQADYLLMDFHVTDSAGVATHFQTHLKRAGQDDYDWTLFSLSGSDLKQLFAVHYHRTAN
jgi:hypothetical protein